jgi:phosphoribosylaminoimidazole carboxylase (NCAIR synthetase)
LTIHEHEILKRFPVNAIKRPDAITKSKVSNLERLCIALQSLGIFCVSRFCFGRHI